MSNELTKRLGEQDIELELTDEAKTKIVDVGYDPEYGARPLRRAIQKHIEDRLSEELLKGTVLIGGKVLVDVVDGEFVVKTGIDAEQRNCGKRRSTRKIKSELDSPPTDSSFRWEWAVLFVFGGFHGKKKIEVYV